MSALNVGKTDIPMVLSVPTLPRLYRRFLRFMFEFIFANIHVPRHFGSFAVLFFFFVTMLYGISSSGHMEMIMRTAISDVGFVITDVDMSGNKRIVKQEILRILGLDVSPSILDFDVDKARSILEQQAWIQSANVQKIYPNRVRITLVEREPYAVWQHDGMMDIIDSTGSVIVPFQRGLVRNLPFIIGHGAQNTAKAFIQALSGYPQFYDHIRAYIRVGDRRWDLILDNGVRVMLPENDAFERLTFLIKTGAVQDLFSRDILSIDLRLSDRITVSLSDEALERHGATVEEERILKVKKAGGL
ncbi:cell division protein FtsQ/DivIB [Bartonella sp. B35(2025)]